MSMVALKGSNAALLHDKSGQPLAVHDYRGHEFTSIPSSLNNYLLDRTSLVSLLALGAKNFRKVVFYKEELFDLTLKDLDLTGAQFIQCKLPQSFTTCVLRLAVFTTNCANTIFDKCYLAFADFTGAWNLHGQQLRTSNRGEAKFINPQKIECEVQAQPVPAKKHSFVANIFGDNKERVTPKDVKISQAVPEASPQLSFKQREQLKRLFANSQHSFAEEGEQKYQNKLAAERKKLFLSRTSSSPSRNH